MTRTPGPWTSDGMANDMMEFRIYSPTGRVIAKIQDFTTFREDVEQAEANVAYIIRACNSHEAMLEALKAACQDIRLAAEIHKAKGLEAASEELRSHERIYQKAIRLAEGKIE